jgi:hypothetical protein
MPEVAQRTSGPPGRADAGLRGLEGGPPAWRTGGLPPPRAPWPRPIWRTADGGPQYRTYPETRVALSPYRTNPGTRVSISLQALPKRPRFQQCHPGLSVPAMKRAAAWHRGSRAKAPSLQRSEAAAGLTLIVLELAVLHCYAACLRRGRQSGDCPAPPHVPEAQIVAAPIGHFGCLYTAVQPVLCVSGPPGQLHSGTDP